MAIADVYDALVSKRVYKDRMSFEKAHSIIMEGMGTQFDPSLEKIFLLAEPELQAYYSKMEEAEEKSIVITKDVYTDNPTDAFRFAASVAEFAQTLRGSDNNGNGSLEHVYEILKELDLDDEYKEEFKYLVRTLLGGE